jgi:hypothetical protein
MNKPFYLLLLAGLAASSVVHAQEATPVAPVLPATTLPPAVASPPAPLMPPPVFPPGAGAPPAPATPAAPPPSSGLAWLVVGGLATAGGIGNLATSPLCELHAIRLSARTPCLGMSLAFGAGLLALGIPLLVVGSGKRSAWMDWTKRARVGFVGIPGGGAATWTTAF